MPPLVTVIGDALLDVHVLPSQPVRSGADVPASIRLQPGGQGANLAVRLARRSVGVRLVCAIGHDGAGAVVRDALAADGVDLIEVAADRTGAVVILLDEARDRTMLSQRVPLLERAVVDLDWASVFDTDWLVVSGYALLEPGVGLSATGPVPRRLIAGCALDRSEAPRWLAAAASLAPQLVTVNLDEARTLAGQAVDPMSLARRLGEGLAAIVVVTHPNGASAVIADGEIEATAEAAGPMVDTTGAGDAFAAALVAGLLGSEWPPSAAAMRRAMDDAVGLASAVTRTQGAQGLVGGERRGADR